MNSPPIVARLKKRHGGRFDGSANQGTVLCTIQTPQLIEFLWSQSSILSACLPWLCFSLPGLPWSYCYCFPGISSPLQIDRVTSFEWVLANSSANGLTSEPHILRRRGYLSSTLCSAVRSDDVFKNERISQAALLVILIWHRDRYECSLLVMIKHPLQYSTIAFVDFVVSCSAIRRQ